MNNKAMLMFMYILLVMPFLLKNAQCINCTSNFCAKAKIKCPGVVCGPNQVYQRRGGGLCGCCPICNSTATPDGRCNPNFCDNIKVNCLPVECGLNEVASVKPELCRCCPVCYPNTTTSTPPDARCDPKFCDTIKVKCVAVQCGPNEVALTKPELCRCCPACYPKEKKPCG